MTVGQQSARDECLFIFGLRHHVVKIWLVHLRQLHNPPLYAVKNWLDWYEQVICRDKHARAGLNRAAQVDLKAKQRVVNEKGKH